jgi:hypothetical protein
VLRGLRRSFVLRPSSHVDLDLDLDLDLDGDGDVRAGSFLLATSD